MHDASKRYSVVFTSGGVGPTHDDVTYESVAKGLGLKLEQHEELIDLLARLFPGEEEAYRLAVVPMPCELVYVDSPKRYAIVKANNVYVLPGSPKYFEPAVDVIVPRLNAATPMHFEYIDIDTNELSIVKILEEHAKRWKDKVSIGSYPQKTPEPFTRITLEGSKDDVLQAKGELFYFLPIQKVRNLERGFSDYQVKSIFEDGESLAHVKSALNIVIQCYETYNPEEIFLTFNGGKDCTVVLHLAAAVAKVRNISSLLCLYVTADSFPEVDTFVERAALYYGLELVRKERPIKEALTSLLNERRDVKAGLMGMRKGDPGTNNLESFTPTDADWPRLIRVNPILNWTYEQVWQFLLKHNVPYCSLYDQGYTSLGTRATTVPNPRLKDPNNPTSYFPAYTLTDESAERQGRI